MTAIYFQNSVILCDLSSSEEESETNVNVIRRCLRDRSNPLSLSNAMFKKRFRLSKEAFNKVLSSLEFSGHMQTAVPHVLQLAGTLSLLANGSFQYCIGNDFLLGMGQSTLCRIAGRVCKEIESKLCPIYINFALENTDKCKEYFFKKYNIPGVIGCIDGTHFVMQKPTPNDHMYLNRKGFHSLNAMIICDHEHKINAINCKYGGASSDAYVWQQSQERDYLEKAYLNNKRKEWLLGDSEYPIEPWCIPPFPAPKVGSAESHFNDVHSKARCIVHETISIYKVQWQILSNRSRSRYTAEKMALFGNVCAALHNICIHFRDNLYLIIENEKPQLDTNIYGNGESPFTKIGEQIRNDIKLSLFKTKRKRINNV